MKTNISLDSNKTQILYYKTKQYIGFYSYRTWKLWYFHAADDDRCPGKAVEECSVTGLVIELASFLSIIDPGFAVLPYSRHSECEFAGGFKLVCNPLLALPDTIDKDPDEVFGDGARDGELAVW